MLRPVQTAILLTAIPLTAPFSMGLAQAENTTAPPPAAPVVASAPAPYARRVVEEGIALDLRLENLTPERPPGTFLEGDDVRVALGISDTASGSPLSNLYPGGWMDLLPTVAEPRPESCEAKVAAFVGGSLLALPELDLNTYYVLTLNDDASISVVDPLFGFGGTKLLAMPLLETPGEDWVVSSDQQRIFVSMPRSDKVAVVETLNWKTVFNVEVGPAPVRLALQPDGFFLWVSYEGPVDGSAPSGVSVVNTRQLREVARLATGRGRHDLALAGERYLFVTNSLDGTVSVIDTRTLTKIEDLVTGQEPAAVAYSPLGGAVYVTHRREGTIVSIDAERHEIVARLPAEPGVGPIRFAPGGRWGFALNPERNLMHIIDAATHRIVQTAETEAGPDQVTFSDEMAYLRHRGSEIVLMVPLAGIGQEGAPVPVIDFPGGTNPPGSVDMPSPADGIVQAPGAQAMLVANAGDQAIYFYKEGMAAPMGHFQNYDREPRAVTVIDRSLRQGKPGTYETTVKMRRPGRYELALLLDSPRMVKCFDFEVGENPVLAFEREQRGVDAALLVDERTVPVGKPVKIGVLVLDRKTAAPQNGLDDVWVLTFLSPGIWQQRQWAEAKGEGLYEIEFTPPRDGTYYVYVEIASKGLEFNESPSVIVQAGNPGLPPPPAAAAQNRPAPGDL